MSLFHFIWEQGTSLFLFFPQINSSVQCWGIKRGWNLLGVRMWSPLIEEYGNKTFTWTRQGSWAPRRRKRQKETSLDTIFFSRLLPHHNVELEEFKDSGGGATWRNKGILMLGCASVTPKQMLLEGKKKELPSCKFPPARWSKKHESARTSNILDSQVEERKLLHTNLIQTEKKSSWDNGRESLHKIKIDSFKQV